LKKEYNASTMKEFDGAEARFDKAWAKILSLIETAVI